MNNLSKVIALGGRRLNKALAMHYLFGEQGIPKDYVQDSLIMRLDGILNTRKGHNSEATVWEDLVGDVNFTKTDSFSFADNYIATTGKITSNNAIVVPSEYTLEIIYQYDGTNYHAIGFSGGSPMFKGRRVGLLPRWVDENNWTAGLEYTYALDINGTHSVAVSQNAKGRKCYHNGIFNNGDSVVSTYTSAQNLVNYSASEVLTGKIYAIRLHSRALSEEELARNYAVDAIRFGLVEPASPEYIEFNGTQYVKLDLPFTKDTVCRIKFNTTIATGDCIMGSSSAFRFFNARGGTYLDWGRGSGGDRITGGVTPEGKIHYREFGNNYVKDLDTGEIIISGEKYGDNIRYDGLPICIMGNPYQKCAQGIVYLAEVIQNGETVRSLLPDIGDAGELGFRDSITGKFYGVINKEAASTMSLRMADEEASE